MSSYLKRNSKISKTAKKNKFRIEQDKNIHIKMKIKIFVLVTEPSAAVLMEKPNDVYLKYLSTDPQP